MKYLRINLKKDVKHLYMKDYKTLLREIKEDQTKELYCAYRLEDSMRLR